jgi:hypothetical protein
MAYLFLAIAVGLFALSIRLTGGGSKLRLVVTATQDAAAVMTSRTLDEEAKEAAIRTAAIGMFGHTFSILVRLAFALAVPSAFVLLGAALGFYQIDDAMRAATNWYFILGSTAVMVGALVVVR